MRNPSKALRNFRKSLRVVRGLAALEGRYKVPIPPRSRAKSRGLLGGACLLLSGILENYLKEVFSEGVADLSKRLKLHTHASLPSEFKTKNVLNYPKWVSRSRIASVDRVSGLEAYSKIVASEGIFFESFNKTNSNPNSETMKEMFRDVGLKDVFAVIETEYAKRGTPVLSSQTIVQTLDSFIRIRNEYAHLGNTGGHTRADLKSNIEFVSNLAESVDAVLVAHVSSIK